MNKTNIMQDLSVREIMTSGLVTVKSSDTVSRVAQLFDDNPFHHLPVVDDDGLLTGIISLTDFERIKSGTTMFRNTDKEAYNMTLFRTLLASDIMTADVVALQAEDTIRKAYDIFSKNMFRALPVMDGDQLVGIVTPLDILDHFFR